MELPENMTISEAYRPAMEITEQSQADEYLEALIARSMRFFGRTREQATEIEKQNLGYYAGYYDSETRRRVGKLFQCAHPIFGAIAEKGEPTAEEALNAGVKLAEQVTKQ